MAVLIDFRCRGCGVTATRWTSTPAPPTVECVHCGADAQRVWAAVGLAPGARPPSDRPPASGRLCARYPQVPGLCHLSESAGRTWLARYTGDGRALEREQRHQEAAAAHTPPVLGDAITHTHFDRT